MCGVIGTINLKLNEEVLDLIGHRGPDGSGLMSLSQGGHSISLGHRRLAIVDLSAHGSQPMSVPGEKRHIVFNGEIYNHEALRQEMSGTTFRGRSDTETILHQISQQGIAAVERFNGIFALGFVDLDRQRLYLARDPFGVKPLYYRCTGDQLVFSSEIKPMLAIEQDEVDMANLAELFRLRYLPAPNTLFRNIRKVRPGHIVEIDFSAEQLTIREYSYQKPVPKVRPLAFGEAVRQYGEHFSAAVRRQLMSDVEVGVLLSGGIDSAMVAAYAQQHSQQPLKAFTVGFKEQGERADEVRDAEITARELGLDHHVVRMGFEDFLESIRTCASIVEEPTATGSLGPMLKLSALAAENVKVVLSGQGADEPLGGYRRYQIELLQHFFPRGLARLLLPLAKTVGIRNDAVLRGLDAVGEKEDVARFLRVYTLFNDAEVQRLTGVSDRLSIERIEYFYELLNCAGKSRVSPE